MPDQRCKGDLHTGARCRCSRARPGEAISIRGPCTRCHERRCKTHCRCGRQGTATGRSAARPSRILGVLRAAPVPRLANFAARPVGAPAALGFQVLSVSLWWASLLKEVKKASSEILVASYIFDHPALTRALVQKLSGRDAFAVVVLVDKEQFDTRACYHQRPRLAELHAAVAAVYLCRGNPPLGSFHTKTVCIDKRSAYFGSANLTKKSADNDELTTRVVGTPVADILSRVEAARRRGSLWGARRRLDDDCT